MDQNDKIKVSEILVKLFNNNINNRLSVELCSGILNIFTHELDNLIENSKNSDK